MFIAHLLNGLFLSPKGESGIADLPDQKAPRRRRFRREGLRRVAGKEKPALRFDYAVGSDSAVEHAKSRCIPLRVRQTLGIVLYASLSGSSGGSDMLHLLHQIYRKGNQLTNRPDTV